MTRKTTSIKIDPELWKKVKKYCIDKEIDISWIPVFKIISRRFCEMYDTREDIKAGQPPKYKHIERQCELPNCSFERDLVKHFSHLYKQQIFYTRSFLSTADQGQLSCQLVWTRTHT